MAGATLNDTFSTQVLPPALRRRVLSDLRARGTLSAPATRRPSLRWGGLAAATLVLGFAIGRHLPDMRDGGSRYLLLLYEDSTFVSDRPIEEIVAEYSAWADSLADAGTLVSGEKLGSARVIVGDSANGMHLASPSTPHPTGQFIVRASSLAEAERIAASSPHVRRRGVVSVTVIE